MESKFLKPKLFASSQSTELAQKIAAEYGEVLGTVRKNIFSDGEFQVSFEESIRGRRIFLIGSTMPPNDNLMEMLQNVLPPDISQPLYLILVGQDKIVKTNLVFPLRPKWLPKFCNLPALPE